MHIRTPLDIFLEGGRFVRRDLSTGTETLLSNHGFQYVPSIVVSADHRWISYSDELADQKRTQYWLYDRATGTDRLVMEHPAWGGSLPVLSPDGSRLAIAANYDGRWPDANMVATYVFDTATLRPLARFPISDSVPRESAWTSLAWSRDGQRLLLVTLDERPKSTAREYRSWRLGDPSAVPIEGRLVTNGSNPKGDVWLVNGEEIPLDEPESLQGATVSNHPQSPDGQWTFRLEEHGDQVALNVSGRDGRTREADRGRYQQCEGFGLVVIGWLDAGHLVYQKPDGAPLVYEAATGRIAPLLGDQESTHAYYW